MDFTDLLKRPDTANCVAVVHTCVSAYENQCLFILAPGDQGSYIGLHDGLKTNLVYPA